MQLDPNCIRAVLMAIEEKQKVTCTKGGSLYISALTLDCLLKDENLKSCYSLEDIAYSVRQLYEHRFIDGNFPRDRGDLYAIIDDITPNGHQFIANIVDESNWELVKEISQKSKSLSLATLQAVAIEVVKNNFSSLLKDII